MTMKEHHLKKNVQVLKGKASIIKATAVAKSIRVARAKKVMSRASSRMMCSMIDLYTPKSALVHCHLKSVINQQTFSLLSDDQQNYLATLLPTCDRLCNNGTFQRSEILNNEFFTKACSEWTERLSEGEFIDERQKEDFRPFNEFKKKRQEITCHLTNSGHSFSNVNFNNKEQKLSDPGPSNWQPTIASTSSSMRPNNKGVSCDVNCSDKRIVNNVSFISPVESRDCVVDRTSNGQQFLPLVGKKAPKVNCYSPASSTSSKSCSQGALLNSSDGSYALTGVKYENARVAILDHNYCRPESFNELRLAQEIIASPRSVNPSFRPNILSKNSPPGRKSTSPESGSSAGSNKNSSNQAGFPINTNPGLPISKNPGFPIITNPVTVGPSVSLIRLCSPYVSKDHAMEGSCKTSKADDLNLNVDNHCIRQPILKLNKVDQLDVFKGKQSIFTNSVTNLSKLTVELNGCCSTREMEQRKSTAVTQDKLPGVVVINRSDPVPTVKHVFSLSSTPVVSTNTMQNCAREVCNNIESLDQENFQGSNGEEFEYKKLDGKICVEKTDFLFVENGICDRGNESTHCSEKETFEPNKRRCNADGGLIDGIRGVSARHEMQNGVHCSRTEPSCSGDELHHSADELHRSRHELHDNECEFEMQNNNTICLQISSCNRKSSSSTADDLMSMTEVSTDSSVSSSNSKSKFIVIVFHRRLKKGRRLVEGWKNRLHGVSSSTASNYPMPDPHITSLVQSLVDSNACRFPIVHRTSISDNRECGSSGSSPVCSDLGSESLPNEVDARKPSNCDMISDRSLDPEHPVEHGADHVLTACQDACTSFAWESINSYNRSLIQLNRLSSLMAGNNIACSIFQRCARY